ncbi:haloacid dehalogenase type II [Agrococcus sp. BE272]|uniref:haloacid dehalogenase type II n=1 Tax=Agrococcus sp. BE272 TaxID=2817727 RepID=UPI002858C56F|nr:haloacid dehalogenase type II [Agrococcus sp. BE272]MDR7233922.1 2-haloacid dehalogenase [Agrococcus sp. BE272]
MMVPELILFDVNETLSDMSPMGAAFAAEGLAPHQVPTWFAAVLRDGFAAAAAGGTAVFAEVAREGLERLLDAGGAADASASARRILAVMQRLDVHADVPHAVEALASMTQLATLSNGAASVAEGLLRRAGVRDRFAALLSVDDAPAWKPSPTAYAYAADALARDPREMLLVAVHPWDIHGAARAGLRTAWINRDHATYPGYFEPPELQASDLESLAGQLAAEG